MNAEQALQLTENTVEQRKALAVQRQRDYERTYAKEIQSSLSKLYDMIKTRAQQGKTELRFMSGHVAKTVPEACKRFEDRSHPTYWSVDKEFCKAIVDRLRQNGFRVTTSGYYPSVIHWDRRE